MDFWTPVFWNFAHLTDIYQICKSKFLPTTAPILQKTDDRTKNNNKQNKNICRARNKEKKHIS